MRGICLFIKARSRIAASVHSPFSSHSADSCFRSCTAFYLVIPFHILLILSILSLNMSAIAAIRSLRLSQGIFTAVNLGLASYRKSANFMHHLEQPLNRPTVTHEVGNLTSNATVSLVAACVSIVGALCAPSASDITARNCTYNCFQCDL